VSWIEEGEKEDAEVLRYVRWTFTGDWLTSTKAHTITKNGKTEVIGQGGRLVSLYKLDLMQRIKTMDVTAVDINEMALSGETIKSIYRLQGDTLTVCGSFSGDRPAEFSAEANSGRALIVFKRK
jgi:uncharacterized protein (TIGR03067 family)